MRKCADNLGISQSALKTWMKSAKEHEGSIPTRGSGNYASDEAKKIVRLQRELRDTKDALEVLKKQSVFWENDKNSIFFHIKVCGRVFVRLFHTQECSISFHSLIHIGFA